MIQELCLVLGHRPAGENIFTLGFTSPAIARMTRAGQFLNIKVGEGADPLLRRPFSVYHTDGAVVEIVFNVIGRGTAALCRKQPGETIDVLGPLGVPYGIETPDFETGVLVAGGLGVAPMPLATRALRASGKQVVTFLGAHNAGSIVAAHLLNVRLSTDDGSSGFHGTVVDLARQSLARREFRRPKIFACGPTAMLRAIARLAEELEIACEVSLEGPMACGFGICQGCPVELAGGGYALMCKDGPVFDISRIIL
jgi:dihydroorotate dehydrogenase electron transfer subunit